MRHQVQLDNHAFATLLLDCLLQPGGIGGIPGRQHDEEAFCGKLLSDGTADPPARTDGYIAVVDHLTVREFGVTAI